LGDFFSGFSFAFVNRRLVKQLLERGNIDISIRTQPIVVDRVEPEYRDFALIAARGVEAPDITVANGMTPNRSVPARSRYVYYLPWEFGAMPVFWYEALREECDEIWVPSTYNVETYIGDGFPRQRLSLVPHGVDTAIFHPESRDTRYPPRFRFLFVGATIPRKGIDVAINAYIRAFMPSDDVVLTIKDVNALSFYRDTNKRTEIGELLRQSNLPRIEYVEATISDRDMANLYREADCLIHPYRGEGFAMPVLEAMACGLPVMVTAGGATDDFVDESVGWRIPSARVECPPGEPVPTMSSAWLMEADVDALASLMRFAYEHPQDSRLRGEAAARRAATWTWDRAAQIAEERLFDIASRTPLPSSLRDARRRDAHVYEERNSGASLIDGILVELFRRMPAQQPRFVEFNIIESIELASVLSIGMQWPGILVDANSFAPEATLAALTAQGIRPGFELLALTLKHAREILDALASLQPRAIVHQGGGEGAVFTEHARRLGYVQVARESQRGDELFVRKDLVDRAGFAPLF
jgi:hypothetical protein